jgi:hypothetical protein
MNKRTKLYLTIMTALIILDLMHSGLAASFYSIADLPKVEQDGWHQTYEAKGRTIIVDVDIEIPSVDRFPIVEVAFPGVMPIFDDRAEVWTQDETAINITVQDSIEIFQGTESGQPTRYLEPNAMPENNPFTPEQAKIFIDTFLAQYDPLLGTQEYEMKAFFANSRMYKIVSMGTDGAILDYEKPVSKVGAYSYDVLQKFHGIPYLAYYAPRSVPRADDNLPFPPSGMIGGYIANENNYSILFEPAKEVALYADDVPLVSFEKCKTELEQLISAGLLREVYSVRLGYMAHQNPDNLGKSFLLLPVWYVRGKLVEKATAPDDPTMESALGEYFPMCRGTELIFLAQTGEYKNPQDASIRRDYADNIITWDDIQ